MQRQIAGCMTCAMLCDRTRRSMRRLMQNHEYYSIFAQEIAESAIGGRKNRERAAIVLFSFGMLRAVYLKRSSKS